MTKIVVSSDMVAHLWAHQSQATANNGSKHRGPPSFRFEGPVLYSYATPIARIYPADVGLPVTLLTSRTYSVTTSGKHMPKARRAATGRVFVVPCIGTNGGYNTNDHAPGSWAMHATNLEDWGNQALAQAKKIKRAARMDDAYAFECLQAIRVNVCAYASAFDLLMPLQFTQEHWEPFVHGLVRFRHERRLRLDTPAARAKRGKVQAAKDVINANGKRAHLQLLAQNAEAWRAGVAVQYGYLLHDVPCMLRVKPGQADTVQTSWGAEFPLDDARRAFKFIEHRRTLGLPWANTGSVPGYQLGAFKLDRVSATGGVVAGCHTLAWDEIQRFAAAQGWTPYTCKGCGREESECSRSPCADVLADREATT